jgi:DGQHR domain-containing protein
MATNKQFIEFKCTEISQPIGTFYIGVIEARDLLKISYSDIRRIERREVEEYLGIERPLSLDRVKELQQYVNLMDATFPTSVILAVSSEHSKYDAKSGIMKIKNDENIAKIIDGQHRIAGLEKFNGEIFQVNVTVFVDMDMEDQAMVFATINLKQTKVSKSLAYDLFEFAKSRSPQKTCHNIAKLLNKKSGSPFKNKIKILGMATGKVEETLTQATFVESSIVYISENPMQDRDILKRGKSLKKVDAKESEKLIFRNMFIDNKDQEIAKILWNYFEAVNEKWKVAWSTKKTGNILNRTTGFHALMKFLKPAYLSFNKIGAIINTKEFYEIFTKIDLEDSDFNPERYIPGSGGETALYHELCEKANLPLR